MAFLGHVLEDICSGLSFQWVNQPWGPCSASYPPRVNTQKCPVCTKDSLASMLTTTAMAAPVCQWQAGQAGSDSDGVWEDTMHLVPKGTVTSNVKWDQMGAFRGHRQTKDKRELNTTSPSPSITCTTARTDFQMNYIESFNSKSTKQPAFTYGNNLQFPLFSPHLHLSSLFLAACIQ